MLLSHLQYDPGVIWERQKERTSPSGKEWLMVVVVCSVKQTELYCNLGPLAELIRQRAKYLGWSRVESVDNAQNVALDAISNPVFREYQELLNEIKNLELKAVIEEASGNKEEASALRERAGGLQSQSSALLEKLGEDERKTGSLQYRTALADNIEDPRVNAKNAVD